MTLEAILVWLIVGAVAGWLASTLMKTGGFGLVGNIVFGIIGAIVGGWLFPKIGIAVGTGLWGGIVTATMGAVVLLAVARLFGARRT